MTNLNKTYHKGIYRGSEWCKHLRPYLKRLGNKRFRKVAATLESDEVERFHKANRKSKKKKKIKVKITKRVWGDSKSTSYRSYRSMRDLNNAISRPNVIQYLIIDGGE